MDGGDARVDTDGSPQVFEENLMILDQYVADHRSGPKSEGLFSLMRDRYVFDHSNFVDLLVKFLEDKMDLYQRQYLAYTKLMGIIICYFSIVSRMESSEEDFPTKFEGGLSRLIGILIETFDFVIRSAAGAEDKKKDRGILRLVNSIRSVLVDMDSKLSDLLISRTRPREGSSTVASEVLFALSTETLLKSNSTNASRKGILESCRKDLVKIILNVASHTSEVGTYKLKLFGKVIGYAMNEDDVTGMFFPAISRAILRNASLALRTIDLIVCYLSEKVFYALVDRLIKPLMKCRSHVIDKQISGIFSSVLVNICQSAKNPDRNDNLVDVLLDNTDTPGVTPQIRATCLEALTTIKCNSDKTKKIIQSCIKTLQKDLSYAVQCSTACCIASKVNYLSADLVKDTDFFSTLINWIKSDTTSRKSAVRIVPVLMLSQVNDRGALLGLVENSSDDTNINNVVIRLVDAFKSCKIGPLDPKSATSYSDLVLGLEWLYKVLTLKSELHLEYFNSEEIIATIRSSVSYFFIKKYYSKLLKSEQEKTAFARVLAHILADRLGIFELDDSGTDSDARNTLSELSVGALTYIAICVPDGNVIDCFFRTYYDDMYSGDDDNDLLKQYNLLTGRLKRMSKAFSVGIENFIVTAPEYSSLPAQTKSLGVYEDKTIISSKNHFSRINKIIRTLFSFASRITYELVATHNFDVCSYDIHNMEELMMDWANVLNHWALVKSYGPDYWIYLCSTIPGVNFADAVKIHAPNFIKDFLDRPCDLSSLSGLDEKQLLSVSRNATMSVISSISTINAASVLKVVFPWILEVLNSNDYASVTFEDIEALRSASDYSKLANDKSGNISPDSPAKKYSMHKKPDSNVSQKPKVTDKSIRHGCKSNGDRRRTDESNLASNVKLCWLKLHTGVDCLNAVVNGLKRGTCPESMRSIEVYIYPIVNAILTGVIIRENYNIYNTNSGKKPVILVGNEKLVKFLADLTTLIMRGSELECLTGDQPQLVNAILCASGICDGVLEHTSCMEVYEKALIVVLEHLRNFCNKDNSSLVTIYQFFLIFTLIKLTVFNSSLISSSNVLSDAIPTFTEFLVLSSPLASSPSFRYSEVASCLIRILKNYPGIRETVMDGLISLCSSIDFYAAQDRDRDYNRIEWMDRYPQISSPRQNISEMINIILEGLVDEDVYVREACIFFPILSDFECIENSDIEMWLWVAKFDDEPSVSAEASRLWNLFSKGRYPSENAVDAMLGRSLVIENSRFSNWHKALSDALSYYPEKLYGIIDVLLSDYVKLVPHTKEPESIYWIENDEIERVLEKKSNLRFNIASVLHFCTGLFVTEETQRKLFEQLVLSSALGDPHPTVRTEFISAAVSVAMNAGAENAKTISFVLDECIQNVTFKSEEAGIYMKEAYDILIAALATSQKDRKATRSVVQKLIDSLSMHSRTFQVTISGCLPSLIALEGDEYRQEIVNLLLERLYDASTTKEKVGYAYGLANVLYGPNISYIIDSGVLESLKSALSRARGNLKRCESAVVAFSALSCTMGRLFEPFLVDIFPLIVESLGWVNKNLHKMIRLVCVGIISRLSAHCIKLTFPKLTDGLKDSNWKIKTGIIEVMGNMAKVKPKYLSSSLQLVTPHLIESLGDSHPKVQEAAKLALENFGKVVVNPEMQKVCPIIIRVLSDPGSNYDSALSSLMEVSFVHHIDPPSLALLMPILKKCIKAKSSGIKTKAATIIASVSQLTDSRNLLPYMDDLRKDLSDASLDSDPNVRVASAKSLGVIVAKIGENHFPDLIKELEMKLRDAKGLADRSGVAQCLSYVLAGIGQEKLDSICHTVIKEVGSTDPDIRDSFMTLLMYLIAAYGEKFTPYIEKTIYVVIKGFSDESGAYIQDLSLRIGEIIIKTFFHNRKVMHSLCKNLEFGLISMHWKVRRSSLLLVQHLFEKIMGAEEGTDYEDAHSKSLITSGSVIDKDRAITLIMTCYVLRSDSTSSVRQPALTVLRMVLDNIITFVMSNFATLVKVLIDCHVKYGEYACNLANTSLKETVKNVGLRALDALLQEFTQMVVDGDLFNKRGAFSVLVNALEVAEQISAPASFYNRCIKIVEDGLMCKDSIIRESAVSAFEPIIDIMGDSAAEEITRHLLALAEHNRKSIGYTTQEDIEDSIIAALCSIMNLSRGRIYARCVEILTEKPVTRLKAKALTSVISAADSFMNDQLSKSVDILAELIESTPEYRTEFSKALGTILISVDESGVESFSYFFEEAMDNDDVEQKKMYVSLTKSVFKNNSFKIKQRTIEPWIKLLLESAMEDSDDDLLDLIWESLDVVVNYIEKEEHQHYIHIFWEYINRTKHDIDLRFYKISLIIFINSLMAKDFDVKLESVYGLNKILDEAPIEVFKSSSVQIMGTLIRLIVGKLRFQMKIAVLDNIKFLLQRNKDVLNMFYPQIRRIVTKCMFSPSSREVYSRAGECCLPLVEIQSRLDNFIHELITGASAVDDEDIMDEFIKTLNSVVSLIYKRMLCLNKSVIQELEAFVSRIQDESKYHPGWLGASVLLQFRQTTLHS